MLKRNKIVLALSLLLAGTQANSTAPFRRFSPPIAGLDYYKAAPVRHVESNIRALKSLLVTAELSSSSPEDRNRILQELKDQKLRQTLCTRDCTGIKFWLDHGASLANLTGKNCRDGLAQGGAWTEVNDNGSMVLFIDSGRYMDNGMMLLPGQSSDQQMSDLLKGYDVNEIRFWYDFPLVRDPEDYLTQIQSGIRTGL